MGKTIVVACLVGLIMTVSLAVAQETEPLREKAGPLQGRYYFGSEHHDPPPSEKVDRIGFEIAGEAAKVLYNSLPGKGRPTCEENGIFKSAGNLQCSKYPHDTEHLTEYYCHFGIMLKTGELVNALTDC